MYRDEADNAIEALGGTFASGVVVVGTVWVARRPDRAEGVPLASGSMARQDRRVPLFRRKKDPAEVQAVRPPDQAVLVQVAIPTDGEIGLDEIEDRLIKAIARAGVGEFDGNEIGSEGATLFMYGADADRLFAVVEPVLRSATLPAGSHALIRYGEPGAEVRRVEL